MSIRDVEYWSGTWRGDLAIRAAGLVLLAFAYAATAALVRLTGSRTASEATAYQLLLAASGFLCGSGGAMGLFCGRELLERVEISPRWRRYRRDRIRS